MVRIRLATLDDADAILSIYAPVVTHTHHSFEYDAPSADEMRTRIEKTLERLPWLVYEKEGSIAGYACAGLFRARPAYQWTMEVSAYVREDARGQGVGRALYEALFGCLRL